MSYAAKFNKGNKFNLKINNEEVVYIDLKSLYKDNGSDKTYPVRALYINKKSKFGDAPVIAISNTELVNCPQHLLDTVNEMIADSELVDAVNNGEVSFKIYEYEDSNFNRKCYGVEWC